MKFLATSLILLTLVVLSISAQSLPIGLERSRGRTMLNAIKDDLKKNYYDPTFRGMDIEARFKQSEERIAKASHQNEIFGIIAETLIELNDSHTYFVPPRPVMDLGSGDLWDLIRQQETEARLNSHRFYEAKDELLIWKMPAFDLEPHKVDSSVGRAKKHKALILDLRGNGGGAEETLLRMVSNFFDRDIKLGEIKRRKETKALVAKTRRGEVFGGTLIVLIDSQSGSAAELFARVVQLEKRGTVIGDVSAGVVMRSKFYDHAHGLNEQIFYGASITDSDLIMTDGRSLEHAGVTPDELKLPTPAALAARHDPVLAYAASLAGVAMTPEKAGTLFPVEWLK